MAPRRRTFIVGARYDVGMEETAEAPDPAVVHVGDPPFMLRIAMPDDPGERLVELSDGWFLTDLVWLGTRRANGRLLDGLLSAAADAAEMDLGSEDDLEDDPFDEGDEDLVEGLVEDILVDAFIEGVNAGRTGPIAYPDFATPEDYARVEVEISAIVPFETYRRALDAVEDEARVRGVEVLRVPCDADAYFAWLEASGQANSPEARESYCRLVAQGEIAGPAPDPDDQSKA